MTTEQKLIAMLKENTGSHFLDSGGAYGRNYDHNAKIDDFESRPSIAVDIFEDTFELTIDVYHFLKKALHYDDKMERMNRTFTRFSDKNEETWEDNLQSFCKRLGWKQSEITPTNSCNSECALSQTIQFFVHYDICILQIHGGCDVRGGYTKPVFFWLNEDFSIYNFARITAIVEPKVKYDSAQVEIIPDLPQNGHTYLSTYDAGCSWDNDDSEDGKFEVVDSKILWNGRKVDFCIQ